MSLSNERSAEWLRGAVFALNRAQRDFTVTVPELQAEYVDLLAAAEAHEATKLTAAEVIEAAERDREAAESTAAGLRRALEEIVDEVQTIAYGKEDDVKNDFTSGESHGWSMAYMHLCGIVGPALAASPDEHARRLKSEALRATASELESLRDHIQTEIGPDDARDDIRRVCLNRAKDLRETAERLEKEAPNATR